MTNDYNHPRINREDAWLMYMEWDNGNGPSKSALEAEYMDLMTAHGKTFTKVVKGYFGINTEVPSSASLQIAALRAALLRVGVDPDQVVQDYLVRNAG